MRVVDDTQAKCPDPIRIPGQADLAAERAGVHAAPKLHGSVAANSAPSPGGRAGVGVVGAALQGKPFGY